MGRLISRARRSFIFTPGLNPEMFPKALASGADMVCIELEDGIAPQDKEEAREKTLNFFKEPHKHDGIERIVRINSIREKFGLDDLRAIVGSELPPPAIMIPKVKSAEEVKIIDQLISNAGHSIDLHVIIETNEGLEAAYDIAHSSKRIAAIFFGGIDMAAELRCKNSWDQLLYARSKVVHAAASAGLDVIDVPYLNLADLKGLRKTAKKAKSLGFVGKGTIHPKQIAVINKIFTPSCKEIKEAKRIIDIFESAKTGLVVVDGKLIEKPVVRDMYRIAAIAEKLENKL